MSEGEKNRLIAWNRELSEAHKRLRRALRLARDAVAVRDVTSARTDLLLYCTGFCVALSGHHVSEDIALFPELSARYPALRATIAKLSQDHELIAALLAQLDQGMKSSAAPSELSLHLEGLSAIMESHFQYEERELLEVLSTLDLDADPHALLGPL